MVYPSKGVSFLEANTTPFVRSGRIPFGANSIELFTEKVIWRGSGLPVFILNHDCLAFRLDWPRSGLVRTVALFVDH